MEKLTKSTLSFAPVKGQPGERRLLAMLLESAFFPRLMRTSDGYVSADRSIKEVRLMRDGVDVSEGEIDFTARTFVCPGWLIGDQVEVDIEIPTSGFFALDIHGTACK